MAPPLVLVCLDVGADSHSVFSTAESMTISILGTAQRDVAMRFAKRGENKFTGLSTADGEHTGLPLIDGAVAHLECRMHARHPAGDHTILVGEVLAGHSHHGEALLYGDRAFGHLTPIA
jgi:flavin reductase ActVB